jgi:hypothetical protein
VASKSAVLDYAFPSDNSLRGRHRSHLVVGAAVVIVVTLGFFLLFFNRFSGVRTINGSGLSGQAILAGSLPYRDWFCPVPPMHFLKNAVLTWLFGTAVIMPRIVALFERSLLAVVLYLWLARLFRVPFAAFGAILAIVVSAGDITDPISSYNHDTLFWAVLTGFLASTCLDWPSKRSASICAVLCGVAAGICFSFKQTIGLGITASVPVVVASSIWKTKGFSSARRFCGCFLAGWLVPLSALWLWLFHHHILGLYFRQIFFKGPSAKAAGGTDFLVRFARVTLEDPSVLVGSMIAVLVLLPVLSRFAKSSRPQPEPVGSPRMLVLIFVVSAAAIAAGRFAAYRGLPPFIPLIKSAIMLSLFACGFLTVYFAAVLVLEGIRDQQPQFWLLGTVSFVCAFMLSLSWPAFEAMVMPGLGFLAAAFLDRSSRNSRLVCYAGCSILMFSLVVWKLDFPFGFGDWVEPSVRTATVRSSLPELKGFLLPQPEVTMLDGITHIIREHSRPGDTIFTYPSMPIFHALSGLGLPTYAGDHNIDACPDDIARRDAAILLRVKPAVIVYYREDATFLKSEEILWRGGRASGQREIIAAVETLVKGYSLAGSYDAPPTRLKVEVYVRQ